VGGVQRLVTDFPGSFPGVGLLLLRVVLAVVLLIDGAVRLLAAFAVSDGIVAVMAYASTLIVLGISVALGFLTPIVHLIVIVVEAAGLALGFIQFTTAVWQAPLLTIAIAVAIAMIGPGAYSVDARLFGRREIVIRPRRTATRESVPPTTRK
jgi:uncharacterized membrane protein YphA (DoxX/SURF4 family)